MAINVPIQAIEEAQGLFYERLATKALAEFDKQREIEYFELAGFFAGLSTVEWGHANYQPWEIPSPCHSYYPDSDNYVDGLSQRYKSARVYFSGKHPKDLDWGNTLAALTVWEFTFGIYLLFVKPFEWSWSEIIHSWQIFQYLFKLEKLNSFLLIGKWTMQAIKAIIAWIGDENG
jgi:hypothetical protein